MFIFEVKLTKNREEINAFLDLVFITLIVKTILHF
jgi:hypothetical protein